MAPVNRAIRLVAAQVDFADDDSFGADLARQTVLVESVLAQSKLLTVSTLTSAVIPNVPAGSSLRRLRAGAVYFDAVHAVGVVPSNCNQC